MVSDVFQFEGQSFEIVTGISAMHVFSLGVLLAAAWGYRHLSRKHLEKQGYNM